MSIFEVIMLVCFGAAWPFSIYKSYVSKQTAAKSLIFLYIVVVGYVAGITHKIFFSFDKVIYLYIFNCLMVITDILVYYRNRAFETKGKIIG